MKNVSETKRKFNLIDLLLLALIVAGALALIFRGNLARQIGLEHSGEKAEFLLSLPALDVSDANLFREGETLTDPATGETLGVIRSVRAENALVYSLNEHKEVVRAFDPAKKDLTLVLDGTGVKTEKGFLLNASVFASPGDQLRVLCSGEVFAATVLQASLARDPGAPMD